MRIPRLFTLVALAGLGPLPPLTGLAKFSLFSRVWGDAIVVTDMTQEGRGIVPPTPANPVYYKGVSLGTKLGSIPGDLVPDEKGFDKFVSKILAKQGYIGAQPGGSHEPTLFLVVQWGYMTPRNNLLWFLGYKSSLDTLPDFLEIHPLPIEMILDAADEPIYGIIITAFEYKSASTDRPVAYWQTRVGLTAVGKSMAQALPAMIVAAGPTIGRETRMPVLGDTDNAARGRVELGEMKILGYEDVPAAPSAPADETK
ncbi:MAG TPA: hypothetical protein VHE13_16705 [Opitutus sp.]|nr:hypothetical protein [Opitutus sp.]